VLYRGQDENMSPLRTKMTSAKLEVWETFGDKFVSRR